VRHRAHGDSAHAISPARCLVRRHRQDVSYIYNLAEPEWGVYYLEEFVRSSYDRNGFAIERIWYGSESGREGANPDSRQDLVIAVKAPRS
jgi:hypothetical protein